MLTFFLLLNFAIASPIDVSVIDASTLPTKFAEWKTVPDIKVCTHAPINMTQLNNALRWWKTQGYSFGSIIKSNCVETHNYGFIVIDLIGQGFDLSKSLATTKIHYDLKTKQINWVHIYLVSPVKPRILEHEIGHALGWHHSPMRDHLMFPTWQGGGWDDNGLKKPSLHLTR